MKPSPAQHAFDRQHDAAWLRSLAATHPGTAAILERLAADEERRAREDRLDALWRILRPQLLRLEPDAFDVTALRLVALVHGAPPGKQP